MRYTDYDKLQLKLREYADKKAANGEIELANGILKAKCFIDQECVVITEQQLTDTWIPFTVGYDEDYGMEMLQGELPEEDEEILVTDGGKKMLTWSYKETDDLWQHDEFETAEECISDAKENYEVETGDSIAIGTMCPYTICVDVESMLERLEEDAYEECGEVSENWEISCRKQYSKEMGVLQDKVNELANEYLEKIGEKPSFYKIDDIYTVTIC